MYHFLKSHENKQHGFELKLTRAWLCVINNSNNSNDNNSTTTTCEKLQGEFESCSDHHNVINLGVGEWL